VRVLLFTFQFLEHLPTYCVMNSVIILFVASSLVFSAVLPFPNSSDLPSVYADLSTNSYQLLLGANIFHVKIVWHVMVCLKLYHLLKSISDSPGRGFSCGERPRQ
jgi:hypothetical protein